MNFQIPEEIVKETTKCNKELKCLTGEAILHCNILYQAKDEDIFYQCLEKGDCAYLEPFKETTICTCPIRKEIYQRYKT